MKKELQELRLYVLSSDEQRKRMDEFLAKAMIPALNRIGISPVGVFQWGDASKKDLYVLLPHKSCEAFVTATARLLADETFLKDGAEWLDTPVAKPLYRRIQSTLLLAFDGVPKVEPPAKTAGRVFQLRIYDSYSVKKGQKKIEMFNTGGEIALFRELGMKPVFFGEAIVGPRMPNLAYMVTFESTEAQKAAWAKFVSSAGWKKLSGDPAYKDTVIGKDITNIELTPTDYSQI